MNKRILLMGALCALSMGSHNAINSFPNKKLIYTGIATGAIATLYNYPQQSWRTTKTIGAFTWNYKKQLAACAATVTLYNYFDIGTKIENAWKWTKKTTKSLKKKLIASKELIKKGLYLGTCATGIYLTAIHNNKLVELGSDIANIFELAANKELASEKLLSALITGVGIYATLSWCHNKLFETPRKQENLNSSYSHLPNFVPQQPGNNYQFNYN